MPDTPDNPNAFATGNHEHGGQAGMSLLDYFAGQALQGMYANPQCLDNYKEIAHDAYVAADAMLAERAEREKVE